MHNQEALIIYTDGGSRGNPGPAAIGIVIQSPTRKAQNQKEYSEYIGEATNNEAEYRAVIFALKKAKQILGKETAAKTTLEIRLDSELVGKQLSGEYKILEKELQPLFIEAWNLMRDFGKVVFKIILRQENQRADRLVNAQLDRQMSKLF
jgi:ribonuclease HI